MIRHVLRVAAASAATIALFAGNGTRCAADATPTGTSDLGVDVATLSPVIDNPYAPFARIKRAVYEGKERDEDTGRAVRTRLEVTVRDTAEMMVGARATVVEVREYEDGELVGRTFRYCAQDTAGVVYVLAERVEDLAGGKVVGNDGQWMAGEQGARAGVFMPAGPKVGTTFEPERAPGVAQDRSKVLAVGKTVKVRAGSYPDCIETDHLDTIGKTTMRKVYAKGVGLLREMSPWSSMELVSLETR